MKIHTLLLLKRMFNILGFKKREQFAFTLPLLLHILTYCLHSKTLAHPTSGSRLGTVSFPDPRHLTVSRGTFLVVITGGDATGI